MEGESIPAPLKRAVIIGGGLGGLATAIRLQAFGWGTTVCEAGPTLGGKMNRWTSHGFTFDTGPSLITMPWVFQETFRAGGADLHDYVDLRPLDPIAEYRFADGARFSYSSQIPDLLSTLSKFAPDDISGFFRFLQLGSRLFAVSKATFFSATPFEAPLPEHRSLLRHFPLRNAWGNYNQTVERLFRSPYLRQLFNRYPTYVGSSPYSSPATLLVIPYIEFVFGGYYVNGGLYRIVEGMIDIARRGGVQMLPDTRVHRILTKGSRVTGVQTEEGQTLQADVVVSNGDAALTPELLGQNPEKISNRSMSGLVFLFGIDRELPEVHNHTVMFSEDYRREFGHIFNEQRFPDDPTVYVNVPSRSDRTMVPGRGETVFVMANAPATDGRWTDQQIADARERVFRTLRRSGFPDFSANIVTSDVWTPTRIAERYLMPGGAIYGTDSHGWRNAFFRPPNAHGKVKGLYHVGGSSHPGGGTPTVLMSAAITSRLIQARERQARER